MIGVFDSGSGGLTVLRAMRDRLPSSDVLYFGDIKNAPYGERTREELSELTVQAIKYLTENGATSIVSACNSVSASLAISLFDAFDIAPQRLIEMVGPTARYFRGSDASLCLCATPATIHSGIYQSAFRMIGKDISVVAIPGLAGAIEFGAPEEEIERIIREAFTGVNLADHDALVLACTHYPLVREQFARAFGDVTHIFDPALVVAERVEEQLWPREVGGGSMRFVISKDSVQFRSFAARLFPKDDFTVEVIE